LRLPTSGLIRPNPGKNILRQFPLRPLCLGGKNPLQKQKITKRTHFELCDLPENKWEFQQCVSNLTQKRTHFATPTHSTLISFVRGSTIDNLATAK
jgi:hypothetical protein